MPHLSSCCGTEAAGAPHRRQRTCQTIRARDRYFAGSNERRTRECLGAAPAQRRERRIHAACRRVKSEEVAKPGPKFSEDGEHGTAGRTPVGPVRDIIGLLGSRRLFRVVTGEGHRTKMSDVHAEHAPGALMDPADPWGTLGALVVAAKGARGACVGGGVNCT